MHLHRKCGNRLEIELLLNSEPFEGKWSTAACNELFTADLIWRVLMTHQHVETRLTELHCNCATSRPHCSPQWWIARFLQYGCYSTEKSGGSVLEGAETSPTAFMTPLRCLSDVRQAEYSFNVKNWITSIHPFLSLSERERNCRSVCLNQFFHWGDSVLLSVIEGDAEPDSRPAVAPPRVPGWGDSSRTVSPPCVLPLRPAVVMAAASVQRWISTVLLFYELCMHLMSVVLFLILFTPVA